MDANNDAGRQKSDPAVSEIKAPTMTVGDSERKLETSETSEKQAKMKSDICIEPADDAQRKQLSSIQEVLKHNLAILPERSFQCLLTKDELKLSKPEVTAKIAGLRKELIADLDQETANHKMSDGTIKCLVFLKTFLEKEEIPAVYRLLVAADASIPLNGPIKLQIGNSNTPERLAADLRAGRANIEVNFDPKSFRSTLDEIGKVGGWLIESRRVLKDIASTREIIAVRNLRDKMKFPAEWCIETKEDCKAAAFVMQKASDAARLVTALDNMSKHAEQPTIFQQLVDPAAREELKARVKSCPSFIKISRDRNDTITGIAFDLPRDLNRSSSDWQRSLKELDEWVERNRTPVDQVVAEWTRRGTKVASYENATIEHGNVCRVDKSGLPLKDDRGNPDAMIVQSKDDLGKNFARFNFMQSRAHNDEIVDPKTGNTSFCLTTTTNFYLNPPWSYLNLIGWQAAEPVVIKDQVLRDGNDFMLARHSSGMIVPVQVKGLNSFTEEQELFYRAGQATQFTMDLAMVLSATSELALARQGLVASQSANSALRAANGTLTALKEAEAAAVGVEKIAVRAQVGKLSKLVAALQTPTDILGRAGVGPSALMRCFQRELADKAAGHLFWGGTELVAGLTGFTHSAGAHEDPLLTGLSQLRTGYFTLMIGNGALQLPLGAAKGLLNLRPAPAGHFDQVIALHQLTTPRYLQSAGNLGHKGFFWSQFPLGGLIALDIYGQWKRADNAGKNNYGEEVDEAHKALTGWKRHKTELSPELDVKVQLDTMRKQLPQTGESAQAIDSIFKRTEQLLKPVWLMQGRKATADEQRLWDEELKTFASEILAPNFLLNPDQIEEYEIQRINTVDSDTARFHPALTDQEIGKLQKSNERHWFNKDLQKASAFALMMLLRKPDGTFGTLDMSAEATKTGGLDSTKSGELKPGQQAAEGPPTESLEPTPLFRRAIQLKPWESVITRPTTIADRVNGLAKDPLETLRKLTDVFNPVDAMITRELVKPSDVRTPAQQEITIDDLTRPFEDDLLSHKLAAADVEKVMVSGDVLLGLGRSIHTYAANLEKVIEDGSISAEIRTKAIRRLADIAFSLRGIEREITNPEELTRFRAGSIGCNSDDIFKFFTKIGSTAGDTRFNREMKLNSLYFAYLSEAVFSDSDKERTMKLLLSGNVDELEKEVLSLSAAAYSTPADCKSIESWTKKFNALMFLERQYSGMNILSEEEIGNPADSADTISRQEKVEKLEAITQELLSCAQARCTESDSEQPKQPQAARQYMTLLNKLSVGKLLEQTTVGAVHCSRLEHLDRSENETRRLMSLGFRRQLLELVKSPDPKDGIEFQRLLILSMPSILNSAIADSNQSELNEIKREFNSTLVDALESIVLKTAQRATKQTSPSAARTSTLAVLMQISPEMRQIAINSLRRIGSLDVATTGWFADPKNEKDPAVRLAACKLLRTTLPQSSWHDLQHSILSRSLGKELPETDPTVNAFLRLDYEPVGKRQLQERADKIIDKASMGTPRSSGDIVFTELPMLKCDTRSENFGRVAQGVVGTNWRIWTAGFYAQCRDLQVDDQGVTHFLVGPEILEYQEKQVQLDEWKALKSQFNQKCQSAMGAKDSGAAEEKQELTKARLLLFEIAKRPTAEFLTLSAQQLKRDKEQYSNVNVITTTAVEIEELRFKAVDALANAYKAGSDGEKQILRTYLLNLLLMEISSDKDQDFAIKMKTRALEALTTPGVGRVSRTDLPADLSYNCREDMASVLEQSLSWRSASPELVKSFQMKALGAFSTGGITRETRPVLTALATGQLLKKGFAPEVLVDAEVSTRASNLMAQQDWRLVQFKYTLQRGIPAAHPENLLADAKEKLERFAQTERSPDVRERGVTEDIQADRIQSAAWDILAAARGRTITSQDDPLRTELRNYLISSPHDEVKTTASLALLGSSVIAEDLKIASEGIVDVATQGTRLAVRRDATERVLSLARTNDDTRILVQEAVLKQRQGLDSRLKNIAMMVCLKHIPGINQTVEFKQAKEAFGKDNGNVDNATSLLQEFARLKFNDELGDRQGVRKVLETYASNLYLSSEMKLANEPQAAADDAVKCLNILAGKPVSELPNLNQIDRLRKQLEQQSYSQDDAESIASRGWLGAEAFHTMIDSYERSGKFDSLPSHYLCYALNVSHYYKSHTMSNTNPDLIRHDLRSTAIVQRAVDKGVEQVFSFATPLPRKSKDSIMERNVQYSQWQELVYQNTINIADRTPRIHMADKLQLRKLQLISYSQTAGALLEQAEVLEATYKGATKPQRYHVLEAEARLKLANQRNAELNKAGISTDDDQLTLQVLAHKISACRERLASVQPLPTGVIRLPLQEKRTAN